MFGGFRGLSLLLVCAVGGSTLAVGCGSDDESSEASDKPKYAASEEPVERYIKRTIKLIETTERKKDCGQLSQAYAVSFVRFPCPAPKSLRRSLAAFELLGAEEYGTGAVVDYRSGDRKEGGAILLFVGPDRKWGMSRFGLVSQPSVDSDDEESKDGFDEALDRYLEAVRERDCDQLVQYAAIEGEGKKACKAGLEATQDLAKRLKADPGAEPEYQGGNASFGFYTLETSKPQAENVTISIANVNAKSGNGYAILDVTPTATAARQREVRRQFESQQRKREREAEDSEQQKQPSQSPTTPN